jgi:putative aldouronate transport system permease protein
MYGVLIAFQNYNLVDGFLGSPWVGLDNFRMFVNSRDFSTIMRNTITISFAKLLICFPAPIILALLINEVRIARLKRTIQTITYIPYFFSWVIVSALVFSVLGADNGSLNILLGSLGIIDEPISWMNNRSYFLPILLSANIWRDVGYSSIIYLAAITSINPELYEASAIDGAGRFKQAMTITLPSISPTIIILLILAISNILNAGFEDIFLLTNSFRNGILIPVANVIDTHVYIMGVETQRFSYATAVGLFKSVINVSMLVMANMIARRTTETSLW